MEFVRHSHRIVRIYRGSSIVMSNHDEAPPLLYDHTGCPARWLPDAPRRVIGFDPNRIPRD